MREQVRGPGFTDETTDWSKGWRPTSSGAGPAFGVDQRARQIEANLGYH